MEAVLKLLESYPTWAKAAVLAAAVLIVGVLIFAKLPAKPTSPPPPPAPAPGATAYLHITGITLHPEDPKAAVRVTIDVNGTQTPFPQLGTAQWLQVGPGMNQKSIPLPNFSNYSVRFSMEYRDGRKAQNEVANEVTRAAGGSADGPKTLPFVGDYKLYLVKNGAASAGVAAVINYRIDFNRQAEQ